MNCVWNRLASLSYSLFFPLSSIIAPSIAILFFYVRIFIYYTSLAKTQQCANRERKSISLAKGLFSSFLLFAICWLPYGLVTMIDFNDQLPRTVIMFTMAIAHLNSSINPILYSIFNLTFRRGIITLFKKLICLGASRSTQVVIQRPKYLMAGNQSRKFPIYWRY